MLPILLTNIIKLKNMFISNKQKKLYFKDLKTKNIYNINKLFFM